MLWGSFGIVHIASLLIGAGIITGLYFILRKCSDRVQTIVLGILSFSGIAAIIFNLVTWGSPLEYLPFHLCSLSAMILPVAVFTRNKIISNVLLLWALGAILALVVNTAQANFEIFSWTFVFYFFPHLLEFGISILIFLLKRVKKDVKCIISTTAITFGAYTLIHFINLGVNAYCVKNNVLDYAGNVIKVNYMYSLAPENPVLQLFYNILPYEYWYMYLAISIIVVYLGLVYMPEIIQLAKSKKAK